IFLSPQNFKYSLNRDAGDAGVAPTNQVAYAPGSVSRASVGCGDAFWVEIGLDAQRRKVQVEFPAGWKDGRDSRDAKAGSGIQRQKYCRTSQKNSRHHSADDNIDALLRAK